MILHGIYENGKIRIKEKNLPNIKANVDIYLYEEANRDNTNIKTILENIRKMNIFSDINNPGKWQKDIRNEWR